MLVVQSALSGVEPSLTSLRSAGLDANYIARQRIPFGPVLSARRSWLERTGRLDPGCDEEEIVVIRADTPRAAFNDGRCGSFKGARCWWRDQSASRCLMAPRWSRTDSWWPSARVGAARFIRCATPVTATGCEVSGRQGRGWRSEVRPTDQHPDAPDSACA